MKKIIYYSDELNDDFAENNIKTILTPSTHRYINHNPIYRFFTFIVYHIIASPLVFIFTKIAYHQKFINKKILKKYKKSGYFVYSNHTCLIGDAFMPTLLSFPKKNYLICNPDATSIKGLKTLVSMLGALPIPSTIKGNKNFLEAIKHHLNNKKAITIYPEAHIWPYYTKIRPFKNVSFTYPYMFNVPCFTMTTTYAKRKIGKRPKIVTYVDGPFFCDMSLSKKESVQKLRDEVYNSMLKCSRINTQYEYIKYIHSEKNSLVNQ